MTKSWDEIRMELVTSEIGDGSLTELVRDPSAAARADTLLAQIIAARRRRRLRQRMGAAVALSVACALAVVFLSFVGRPTTTTPPATELRALPFSPSTQSAGRALDDLVAAEGGRPAPSHAYRWSAVDAASASVRVVSLHDDRRDVRTYKSSPPAQPSGTVSTRLPDQPEQFESHLATTSAGGADQIAQIAAQARKDCPDQVAWCTANRLIELRLASDPSTFDSSAFWNAVRQTPDRQTLGRTTSRTGVPAVGIAAQGASGETVTLLADPRTGALVGVERGRRNHAVSEVLVFW